MNISLDKILLSFMDHLTFYFQILINHQIFLPFFILFVVGLANLKFKDYRQKVLLLWIAAPYFLVSFYKYMSIRYTIFVLPAVALISTFYVSQLSNKKSKMVIILLVVVYSFIQFYVVTYGVVNENNSYFGFMPSKYSRSPLEIDFSPKEKLAYLIKNSGVDTLKERRSLKIGVLEFSDRDAIISKESLLTNDEVPVSEAGFRYFNELYRLPIEIVAINVYYRNDTLLSMPYRERDKNIKLNNLDFLDFIILKKETSELRTFENEFIRSIDSSGFRIFNETKFSETNSLIIFKKAVNEQ